MTIRLTDRINRIKASPTSMAASRARKLRAEGRPIISLATGEPDFATPSHVIEAAYEAMTAGKTRYTDAGGSAELRAAICRKFKRENNLSFSDDEVIAGTGAKQVLFNAIMSTIQEGDAAIIPAPGWVSYVDMIKLAGGQPVKVLCGEDDNFKLSVEMLEKAITTNTRLLILNSPANPTGATYTRRELEELGEVLTCRPEVTVICDDIYEHLYYCEKSVNTLAAVRPELAERILTVNGVSKAYAMTGWRLGFAGGPVALIRSMAKIQSQSTGNPSSISQAAAIAALDGPADCVAHMCETFRHRRDMVAQRINAIPGLRAALPDGAFYLFVSVGGLFGRQNAQGHHLTSENCVVNTLLENANVAVVGGSAFGASPYFRMSFAASNASLIEALDRIEDVLGTYN